MKRDWMVLSNLFAALAGGVWGLALARALAESFSASPTWALGPTCGVALTVGIVAAWLASRTRSLCFVPLFLPALYIFWPDVAPTVGWTLLSGSLALTAVSIVGQDGILPGSLALVTLVLYLRTLGPTVGQADTFEFQVVAPTLGVAHPTGYPLYILSGKLFSLLPLGSVAWRINLTSAVFATAAVVGVHRLVRRLASTHLPNQPLSLHLIPLFAALCLAFSRVFWSQAVVAEVYTLHNLFVVVILWSLVRLMKEVASNPTPLRSGDYSPQSPIPNTQYTIYLLSLSLGLSFANHLTTALLLPAVGLALLVARPRVALKTWLVAGGLFVLGLSFYLYIYFRWPTLHDGAWMSLGEFWRYITGQQFGGALRLDAWRTDPTRYEIVGRLLREPFGWPGLILGGVGLFWLVIKWWRVALITGVTFLAFAWYALSYYVPDVSVFLLPAHLILAVWLGVGIAVVMEVMRGIRVIAQRDALISVFISLFSLLPLSLLWTNLPLVDQSGEREAFAWGDAVLNLPIAADAAVLADSARIAPLYYLQRIEGRRPDLDLLVLADEATYRAELETRVAAGQTVYLARFLPGLEGRYHLRSLGPLTEVGAAPLTAAPASARAVGAHFGPTASDGEIELIGHSDPSPGPDGGLGLTLYWRTSVALDQVYHVRLRLVDSAGQVWWGETGGHAANDDYPTLAWRPGEVVADYHEIPPLVADPSVTDAGFSVQVGWFRPFSEEGLAATNGEPWVTLVEAHSPVWVQDAPLAQDVRVWLDRPLLGVTLPDVAPVSSPVGVTLHWDVSSATDKSRLALTWVGAQGERTPVRILEQWGRSRLSIQAPAEAGEYELELSVLDDGGQPVRARCGWLARPSNGCAVATVRVSDVGATAVANLDGKMLLVEAHVGLSSLGPGQSVPVTLQWQALRQMDADYTVSVQLVGPDGRLYGQTDAWPVQGTLPTSQWSPGQRLSDSYEVSLSPDAPPGPYRVGVVVYLLATQTRLPLRDAAGQIVGDVAWVGELAVGEFP